MEKWLKSVGLDTDSTTDALKKINPSQIVDVLTGALSTILGAAGGVFLLRLDGDVLLRHGGAGFRPPHRRAGAHEARAGELAAAVREPDPAIP